MMAAASPAGLAALEFDTATRQKMLATRIAKYSILTTDCSSSQKIIKQAQRWLDAFFAKAFDVCEPPLLNPTGSAFEQKVWAELLKIQRGATTTYGSIGQSLGYTHAAQAIGGATKRNPLSIIIPCHRVIASSGHLTGYGGGLSNKEFLLQWEKNNI